MISFFSLRTVIFVSFIILLTIFHGIKSLISFTESHLTDKRRDPKFSRSKSLVTSHYIINGNLIMIAYFSLYKIEKKIYIEDFPILQLIISYNQIYVVEYFIFVKVFLQGWGNGLVGKSTCCASVRI